MRKLGRLSVILVCLAAIALLVSYLLMEFGVIGSRKGTCGLNGDNVKWSVDWQGRLTFSGSGPMADFTDAPLFPGVEKVRSVTVNPGVTSIGSGVLRGCGKIRVISLPPGMERIGAFAFENCTALCTVNLPAGLLTLEEGAFRGCVNLTTVRLPASLTGIGEGVFEGCTALTTLTFPEGNEYYAVENGAIYRKNHKGTMD